MTDQQPTTSSVKGLEFWVACLALVLPLLSVVAAAGFVLSLPLWFFSSAAWVVVVGLALVLAGLRSRPLPFVGLLASARLCVGVLARTGSGAESCTPAGKAGRLAAVARCFGGDLQEVQPREVVSVSVPRVRFRNPGSVWADCGPPSRLAFQFGASLIDNWGGLVYDPTGEVARIPDAGATTVQALPHPLRGLFGGTIVNCEAVGDDLYDCWFT